MAQTSQELLPIQAELDLMKAEDKKTLVDGETGVNITKYVSYRLRGPERAEICRFTHPAVKERIYIDDESVAIDCICYPPEEIKLMIKVGKLAENLYREGNSETSTTVEGMLNSHFPTSRTISTNNNLYRKEKLLVYALTNLPKNHPIFNTLDTE